MMTVKRLKELLGQFPDDAHCFAYEGEDCGIVILPAYYRMIPIHKRREGFIRATNADPQSEYIEWGFVL
jgi:hypothetical protein